MGLSAATAFTLVSCENPADESTKAKVSDAKEVSTEAPVGEKWNITENSTITFTGSKVTGSHSGGFEAFSGHFHLDGVTLAPTGHQITIDMNSTFSDHEKLTAHLKNKDFFNVETYPTSTFVATGITEQANDAGVTHLLTGNFTLHGVTKSIDIPVSVEKSQDSIAITADFFIDRYDFGIQYKGRKDDLIRKEVVIKFDLKAVKE